MSDPVVWASDVMVNLHSTMSMRNVLESQPDHPLMSSACRLNANGEVLAAENFPTEVWGVSSRFKNDKPLPDIFMGYGPWIVSNTVKEVMKKFDFGNAQFFPIRVFKKDRKTPMPGEWYCLNFGNVKKAYLQGGWDPTPHICKPLSHAMPGVTNLKDDMIVVGTDALVGPDVWVDLQLYNTFFVTNRLAMALNEAGVGRSFGFKRCKVLTSEGSV